MSVHPDAARQLWQRLEALHAVTYFADESRVAATDLGLRGFWMGYFAFRAAPLGPVGAGVVEATFANFAPALVARAVPDAWTFSSIDDVLAARQAAAAASLRRIVPDADLVAEEATALLEPVIDAGSPLGRPLFAANARLPPADDPVARLWQAVTTLREHRGDGHVMALGVAGIDGCEAHVLHSSEFATPPDLFRRSRGWTHDDWRAAVARLEHRHLVDSGSLTHAGVRLRRDVERSTDELAAQPMTLARGGDGVRRLLQLLDGPARSVAASGDVPFPNPIGLAAPADWLPV